MLSKKEFAVVCNLGFISTTNFMLSLVEHEHSFITPALDLSPNANLKVSIPLFGLVYVLFQKYVKIRRKLHHYEAQPS